MQKAGLGGALLERAGILFASLAFTLCVLWVLALLQRQRLPEVEVEPVEEALSVGRISEEESLQTQQVSQQKQVEFPPIEVLDTPSVEVSPIAFSLELNPENLTKWRFEFDELISIKNMDGFASLRELDAEPRQLRSPGALFPESLILQGIYSGEVSLIEEVDEQGFGRVRKVLMSSHPELVPVVVAAYNKALYTTPTRNGKPTKMVMRVNIKFDADLGRINEILKKNAKERD